MSDLSSFAPYTLRGLSLPQAGPDLHRLWSLPDALAGRAGHKLEQAYLNNPFGQGGAVLLHTSGSERAVGALALHRRVAWFGPHHQPLCVLADFVVDPAHRSLGPAVMLMREAAKHCRAEAVIAYGMPNPSSRAVASRAGWQEAQRMHRLGKLLRSDWLWRRQGLGSRAITARAAADVALVGWDALLARIGQGHWRTPDPQDPALDQALDALWAARSASLWLGERSARVLRWRFRIGEPAAPTAPGAAHAPGASGWQLSLLETRRGQPLGYVVWRRHDDLLELGDFGCPDILGDLPALLLSFSRWARRHLHGGALSLELAAPRLLERRLRVLGFIAKGHGDVVLHDPGSLQPGLVPQMLLTTFDRDPDT